jgi:hypothetical protein
MASIKYYNERSDSHPYKMKPLEMYLNRTLELRILQDVCFNLKTDESLERACGTCQINQRFVDLDMHDSRFKGYIWHL